MSGSCGTFSDTDPNVNSYNILALAVAASLAINNAAVGNAYNSMATINNGAEGCADLVFYYVAAGIGLQLNSVSIGGTALPSYTIFGYTVWYLVSGTNLLADRLLCNDGSFIPTANLTELTCSANTVQFGMVWGGKRSQLLRGIRRQHCRKPYYDPATSEDH